MIIMALTKPEVLRLLLLALDVERPCDRIILGAALPQVLLEMRLLLHAVVQRWVMLLKLLLLQILCLLLADCGGVGLLRQHVAKHALMLTSRASGGASTASCVPACIRLWQGCALRGCGW